GTHAVGVVWLWRRRAAAGCDVPATLLLCALFMHLQLYPRADFMHLIDAIPLTAVFTAYLLQRVMEWWRAGLAAAGADGFARAVVPVTVAVLFACMAVRVSPSLAALWAPQFRLPFAVAPVGVEREHASTLEHLGAAAAHLATLVPEGGSSLAFPAADIVLFLSGTRNPTPYAYFFPGRPDHRDEAEIVDALVAAPPLALVSLNRAFTFFDAAPPYYFLLRRFARARYGLAERHGRFDVLALGGEARSPAAAPDHEDGDAVAALRGHPLHETASALLRLATDDDLAVRLNALAAIGDALEAEPSRGLETYVAAAGLDRAREVLLLRTIRDARDARTASYLFAAAARSDARIASEALGAMYVTRAELIARRSLWAGSDAPAVWPGRSELASAVRAILADATAPPRATAFAADLAGALGQHETVPALRARLSADAATAASAADALATLAPGGLACELTRMLERSDLDIVALVPTTLLRLGEQGEPMRREVGACLDDALARPGPGREAAIWIAAALADPRHAVTLRAALAAVEPGVRAAAAWALGELPPEVATTQALRAASESDPDADVRRLAARAVVKQDGRSPRAGTPAPALGNVT
ncbi:MAG: HEAT repeat domain-containing protein, partial [Candidatus Binatia bacterium]